MCRDGRELIAELQRALEDPDPFRAITVLRDDRRLDEPVMLAEHVRPAGAGQPR